LKTHLSRRAWLAQTAAGLATVGAAAPVPGAEEKPAPEPFGYCLNTSTIRGQKLPLVQKYVIAAQARYQAIEPWVPDLDQYVKDGGNLKDLGKRIADLGLKVPSVIGFFEWIVDDDAQRAKGLEVARRSMDMAKQIGGQAIAAPPVGATKQADLDLRKAAERYRALLELGDQMEIIPQVELWGFSQSLSRLGEVLYVAAESQHPKACVLLDVYHLYKGGSDHRALRLVNGAAMRAIHFNDYPAAPARPEIGDANRVYPGDGIAPLKDILRTLQQTGFRGYLSLELFNRDYWQQDALEVARTGLQKMRTVVRASLGSE
jgi:2-keto-myo-inositol isomerase